MIFMFDGFAHVFLLRMSLLTEPVLSKTPFGVTNIPDPTIDPTIMATPLNRVILRFSCTPSSESLSFDDVSPFAIAPLSQYTMCTTEQTGFFLTTGSKYGLYHLKKKGLIGFERFTKINIFHE